MKLIPNIAGALLGILFIVFGLNFFFHFMPEPPAPPADSPPGHFFAALGGTGYFKLVKLLEIIGSVLVALPVARNIGMLILGPILVNIWCFHIFLTGGASLKDPMNAGVMGLITVLALIVLVSGRKAWCGLLGR